MSQFVDVGCKAFTNGATAIDRYLRVKLSSGVLALAGDEPDIGVTSRRVEASVPGDVILRSKPGTTPMVAAKAIAAGDVVYSAADGKVTDAGGAERIGVALDAATGDGAVIEVLRAPNLGGGIKLLTEATYTVTEADHGKTLVATIADTVVTLPPTLAGFEVEVLAAVASTTTGLSLSPDAADQIIGNGFTAADDKDAINTAATDVVGDLLRVKGNGTTGWYITNVIGTWAREA